MQYQIFYEMDRDEAGMVCVCRCQIVQHRDATISALKSREDLALAEFEYLYARVWAHEAGLDKPRTVRRIVAVLCVQYSLSECLVDFLDALRFRIQQVRPYHVADFERQCCMDIVHEVATLEARADGRIRAPFVDNY